MARVLNFLGDAVMLAIAGLLALTGHASTMPHEDQEAPPEGWAEHVRRLEADRGRA